MLCDNIFSINLINIFSALDKRSRINLTIQSHLIICKVFHFLKIVGWVRLCQFIKFQFNCFFKRVCHLLRPNIASDYRILFRGHCFISKCEHTPDVAECFFHLFGQWHLVIIPNYFIRINNIFNLSQISFCQIIKKLFVPLINHLVFQLKNLHSIYNLKIKCVRV